MVCSRTGMLKVDPTLDHVPAKREHVIALFESINQPLVNIPRFGTAPTGAFILGTRNDAGHYTAFVYLYQSETKAVVVYVSEPRQLTTEQYRAEEAESVRFVESMGFMIDNVHFPTLAPPEQEAVMGRIPMFRPPGPTVDLYDEAAATGDQPAADPFGSTDQQLDAIFGGLSASDNDVFRQAGFDSSFSSPPSSPPPVPPPAPSSGLPSGLPSGFVAHGASGLPQNTNPGMPPMGTPSSPPPAPTSSPSITRGSPVPSSQPRSGPHSGGAQPLDAAALERIGKLLGMFAWLVVAAVVFAACRTTTQPASDRALTAQLDIANQHLSQAQFADAIRSFENVLEMDAEHRDALRGIALAYMNLNRFEEAETFYRRAIAVDDSWSMPKNELAVVLIQTGRCAEAETLLEAVLKDIFYPTPEFAEHNLARSRACQGDIDGAVQRLENLVLKRPHFCLGYLTLADLAANAKKHETTISACDDFAHNCEQHEQIKEQVSPEQSDLCYLKKGLAYAELGDLESARSSFMRCQSKGQLGRECKKSLEMLPP